jgi:acetoacetyl-CoA reductase/3-oxoacyl-[acyl-carrier protein] reductase
VKILIAGASGGIGKFLAEKYAKDHQVYGTYASREPESELEYDMAKVDFRQESQVRDWVAQRCDAGNKIVFIYSVGTNYNSMIHKAESDKWKDVIDINLVGVQHSLKHLLPIMRGSQFGRIVLLSSVVPQIGVPGTSAYAASKAGLWGFCKVVAKENARHGITINTLNLGYFDIGMIQDVPAQMLEKIIADIPMGHLGNPENIYSAVNFIISADYFTGSQINLNGGLI